MAEEIKTVVVTGGTVRLGKVIADRLARSGWRVLRTSHRGDGGADIVADLSDPEGPQRLMDAATELNGGRTPEALVNNAALFSGDLGVMTEVNYLSPAQLMALMAKRGGRAVVNVLDCRVMRHDDGEKCDDYTQTKRMLRDETRLVAERHLGRLRVNAVAPGPVMVPVEVHEKAGECPFGRPTPEAVAAAVEWLLSAEFTTGLIVPIDGGQSLGNSSEI